jgi:type I restriction enzyme M protein
MPQNLFTADEREVREFSAQLTDCLIQRGKFPSDFSAHLMSAYALFKAQSASPDSMPAFKSMLASIKGSDLVRYSIADSVEDCWDALRLIYGAYNTKTIAAFILSADLSVSLSRGYSVTPGSVTALALELLEIDDRDSVADFGAGGGGFLVSAFRNNTNAHYYGVEIQNELAAVAAIRAELLGHNVTAEQGNMFSLINSKQQFNKIFANYPFGVKIMNDIEQFIERLDYKPPKCRSSDWIFNLLLLEKLSEQGRAIGVMTCGACFNGADREMREFFVKNGFIEAMIALPDHMFSEINIPTEMVVLSKGNEAIRIVDAAGLCKKGRRQSEFTDEHIRGIAAALKTDSEYSRLVSPADLENDGYNLDPARHLEKPIKINDGVCFGAVIKNITRGAQLNADALDELSSNEPTNYRYLMLRDIQDGLISDQLPFLKYIEARWEKHCVSPGNLVISKNGAPFKVAVIGELGEKSVLANGNLYVIELDETKIKPYYLKAFFESELGIKTLNNIAVGTAMPVIQVEALKSISIPCPSLAEQSEIEKHYIQSVETIRNLKNQLASALEQSKSFFKESD